MPSSSQISQMAEEIRLLRVAVATHLRYLNGEIVDGLRSGRHTSEVAADIGEHQARNLLQAVERTGKLAPDGSASGQFVIRGLDKRG